MGSRLILALALTAVAVGCGSEKGARPSSGTEPATTEPAATESVATEPVASEPEVPPDRTVTGSWEDELMEKVDVLDLTGAEENALRAAYAARDAEVKAFLESDRGRQLSDSEAKLAEAARVGNLAEVKKLTDSAGADRAALQKIIDDGEQHIREALSEYNRTRWDAHRVSSKLITLMESLKLSDDQQEEIQELAVQSMQAANSRQESNPLSAAFVTLEKWTEEQVLTADQRTAYEPVKKSNPLRSLRL